MTYKTFNNKIYIDKREEMTPSSDHQTTGREILNGSNLRVSVFGVPPFVLNGPNGSRFGVDIDITDMLAETFGFSYRFVYPRGWGHYDSKSETWVGTVGKVDERFWH